MIFLLNSYVLFFLYENSFRKLVVCVIMIAYEGHVRYNVHSTSYIVHTWDVYISFLSLCRNVYKKKQVQKWQLFACTLATVFFVHNAHGILKNFVTTKSLTLFQELIFSVKIVAPTDQQATISITIQNIYCTNWSDLN